MRFLRLIKRGRNRIRSSPKLSKDELARRLKWECLPEEVLLSVKENESDAFILSLYQEYEIKKGKREKDTLTLI